MSIMLFSNVKGTRRLARMLTVLLMHLVEHFGQVTVMYLFYFEMFDVACVLISRTLWMALALKEAWNGCISGTVT